MHFNLRVIHEPPASADQTTAAEELRACLNSAVGINALKELKPHPRGGFSITFDAAETAIESLLGHLGSRGFRGVL